MDPSVRGIFSLRLFQEYIKQKGASLFLFKEEDDENVMSILSRYKFEEHILPRSQKEYWYILDKKKVDTVIFKFLFTRKLPKVSELGELYKRIGFLIIAYLYQKPVISGEFFRRKHIPLLSVLRVMMRFPGYGNRILPAVPLLYPAIQKH